LLFIKDEREDDVLQRGQAAAAKKIRNIKSTSEQIHKPVLLSDTFLSEINKAREEE
jgi:hypothetical protein